VVRHEVFLQIVGACAVGAQPEGRWPTVRPVRYPSPGEAPGLQVWFKTLIVPITSLCILSFVSVS